MTLLIRHAESAWNEQFGPYRIDVGLADPGLTARGREQAADLARRLAGQGVRRLITSPYRRTIETARVVAAALDLPIAINPAVRERCAFSCDRGSSPAELAALWPDLDFAGLEEVWWGGLIESWPSLHDRCERFRAAMAARPDRDEVAVIAHWGFIRGLTGVELHNTEFVRLAEAGAAPHS